MTATRQAARLRDGITERTGTVRSEAKVIHAGSSIVTAEGRIVGADGALHAHGTTTCLVLSPR